jgi:hypothetical protein
MRCEKPGRLTQARKGQWVDALASVSAEGGRGTREQRMILTKRTQSIMQAAGETVFPKAIQPR